MALDLLTLRGYKRDEGTFLDLDLLHICEFRKEPLSCRGQHSEGVAVSKIKNTSLQEMECSRVIQVFQNLGCLQWGLVG